MGGAVGKALGLSRDRIVVVSVFFGKVRVEGRLADAVPAFDDWRGGQVGRCRLSRSCAGERCSGRDGSCIGRLLPIRRFFGDRTVVQASVGFRRRRG